ncbi:MAG: SUMF1/EgtB/PvdO family nonheme iron enzyme [Bacteroidia bacterium]|nr:SUMF1/EgtB/PvdO family nonheme iron enzyme [Bacteroidia bacterium]
MKKIAFLFAVSFLISGATKPETKSYLPTGFVLMPAKNNIPPFLISENPVCNFEYLLYLTYLKNIFTDYPEVYMKAIPHVDTTNLFPQNDPLVNAYLGHPAYADYPVVGVNWHQAMEYCSWKTDRLNESICVEMGGIQYPDYFKNCTNENSFNTEAYLNGQFYISPNPVKNHAFFHYTKNYKTNTYEKPFDNSEYLNINNSSNYPAFMYGGRLPSEEEWDYYMANKKHRRRSFSPENSYIEMGNFYNMPSDMIQAYGKNRNKSQNELLYEWMIDTFSNIPVSNTDFTSLFENSGFQMAEMRYFLDQYGSLDTKDSLGTFGFRIMGWKPTGEAIIISKSRHASISKTTKYLSELSKGFKDTITWIYNTNRIDSFRKLYTGNYYWYIQLPGCVLNNYGIVIYTQNQYCQITMPRFSTLEEDLLHITNAANYSYTEFKCIWGCNPNFKLAHVTKNLKTRTSRIEDKGYTDVGFRVVFPYYGNALPEPIAW